jgi:voltage-gated sodium channel
LQEARPSNTTTRDHVSANQPEGNRDTLSGLEQITAPLSRIVESRTFEWFIIAVILANALLLGLGTSPTIERDYGDLLHLGNQVALGIFIVEALMKLLALAPRSHRYFSSGWNIFDFAVIVFSLVPATGEFAMVSRLARLLRVMRLITTVKELRVIVAALVRAIPSVGHVMVLMSIFVYIYAIMGYHLFHEEDPEHWRSLGISVLTLFNIVTLEGWVEIMDNVRDTYPWAWIYFTSFIIIGTFVVINMFIAIIVNSLDEAKADALRALRQPSTADELLREIRETQAALMRLQERLDSEAEK